MTALPAPALAFAWGLRERIVRACLKPLADLRQSIQQAAAPPDLVAAADPSLFQRACMLGLAAVTDFGLDPTLPEPVRLALRGLPQRYQELLHILHPAENAIAASSGDLRNIQHIDGMSAVLYQATQVANPSTPVGVAAIGGATLGTLLMPGLGTAIGGALGVLLSGTQANKRDRRALERFTAAVKLMWAATDDLHNGLWNQVVHSVQQANGPALPDAAFFETADARWQSVKSAAHPTPVPGEPAPFREAIETYLRDWGPHPEALYVAAQMCLPPYRSDLAAAAQWVAQQADLYPTDSGTDENRARLALEVGNFAGSLEAADRGLRLAPKHDGLRHARLEALAALGRVAEAEEIVRPLRAATPAVVPELALIRGLMRGGRRTEAVERVHAWVKRDGKPALIAEQMKAFNVTAPLADGPDLATVLPGRAGQLQAAVERHLHADGSLCFFGEPPGDKGRNAREAFLHLQPEEKVLFFHDWSLWHNAKTGLALTTHRLLWKCAWSDPVAVDLLDVTVTVKEAVLQIGSRSIDMENEGLAAGLARVLQEAETIFHPAGPGRSG